MCVEPCCAARMMKSAYFRRAIQALSMKGVISCFGHALTRKSSKTKQTGIINRIRAQESAGICKQNIRRWAQLKSYRSYSNTRPQAVAFHDVAIPFAAVATPVLPPPLLIPPPPPPPPILCHTTPPVNEQNTIMQKRKSLIIAVVSYLGCIECIPKNPQDW